MVLSRDNEEDCGQNMLCSKADDQVQTGGSVFGASDLRSSMTMGKSRLFEWTMIMDQLKRNNEMISNNMSIMKTLKILSRSCNNMLPDHMKIFKMMQSSMVTEEVITEAFLPEVEQEAM